MTTLHDWLAANEPPFSEMDTERDNVTEPIEPLTIVMATTDGRPLGRVMVGSFAHRALLGGGFVVAEDQS